MAEAVQMGAETYHCLAKVITKKFGSSGKQGPSKPKFLVIWSNKKDSNGNWRRRGLCPTNLPTS